MTCKGNKTVVKTLVFIEMKRSAAEERARAATSKQHRDCCNWRCNRRHELLLIFLFHPGIVKLVAVVGKVGKVRWGEEAGLGVFSWTHKATLMEWLKKRDSLSPCGFIRREELYL